MAAKMLATALMLVASAPAIIRAQGLPGALFDDALAAGRLCCTALSAMRVSACEECPLLRHSSAKHVRVPLNRICALVGALQGPADPAAQGNAMDGTMADPDAPMPIEEMIPDAAELGLLPSPFFVIPDAEYAGNPDVKDLTRFQLDSATACAAECAKNPECHMATWMGANPAWKAGKNCFLKSTPRLCEMPSDITDEPTAYLLVHKAWECARPGPACPESA